MKKIEIPNEIKEAVTSEAYKLIFPNPAKTLGGKLLRGIVKVVFFVVSKKEIKINV